MQKKKYRLSRIEYLLFYAIMTSTKLAEEMRKNSKKLQCNLSGSKVRYLRDPE
jgi:hypothetical protein